MRELTMTCGATTTTGERAAAPRLLLGSLMLLLTASLAVGCAEDGPTTVGALSLAWTAGPVASCAQTELVRVDVELRKDDRVADRRSFACDDGGAFIDAVEPGRYELVVQGVDSDGLATFEAVLPDVRIDEGSEHDLGLVRLTARPARVQLQWYFANGRLCSQNLVEDVTVTVYDSAYYMIASSTFDCDGGLGELEPLPAGSYELEVVGLATGGQQARARRVVPLVVGRGEDLLVDVSLE